jgi:hypothetical protein
MRKRYLTPTRPTGYPLDDGAVNGWFGVLIPSLATNLDTNPSFELGTSGVTTSDAAVEQSSTYQRRGLYSMKVTPAPSLYGNGVAKTVTTTANTPYCFAIDLFDPHCRTFQVYFSGDSGRVGRINEFKAKGYWQRVWANYAEGASGGTRRAWVVLKAGQSTDPFYVDGSLIQAKARPDDYFDGDSMGYLSGKLAYVWNGARHASTSTRFLDTGSGGEEMRLSDLGFTLLGVIGLGLGQFANVATPLSTGGAYYQQSTQQTRQFSIMGELSATTPEQAERQRSELIQALKPKRIPTDQPLTLVYHRVNERTSEETERLIIPAVYESGLEGSVSDLYGQRLGLTFHQFIPVMYGDGEQGAELGKQTTVTDLKYIGYRDLDGTWKAMESGTGGTVFTIEPGMDGKVYAGGTFIFNVDVSTVAAYIAVWDGSEWSAVGTGMNGDVNALAAAPGGVVYAGGNFTTAGGGAATRVAKWSGSAWSALGSGMNDVIYALAVGPDGTLYAGGNFTTAGGGAANYIAKWNGSAWSALGTGMNGLVTSLAVGPDGTLYAGGNFTTAGGVTVNHVAKWSGSAWSALGAGMDGNVLSLAISPTDGRLYAGGSYSTAGSVSASCVAMWDGNNWYALGAGLSGLGLGNAVKTLAISRDGLVHAGGAFTESGSLSLRRAATWTGSAWIPVDVEIASPAEINTMTFDPAGRLFVGGGWALSAKSATVAVVNTSGTAAYPVITFTGPGLLGQIKNYTTGQAIYFDGLTLLAGEVATLHTDPLAAQQFTSNFRGSLTGYIADASTEFYLLGGDNNISTSMTETDSNSEITMTWRPVYDSLDEATR